jgi:hypothetical protein
VSSRAVSITLFGLVAVGILTLDLLARRPESKLPTFGEVFGLLSRTRVGRVLVLGFWAWSGWHFFAR